MFNRKKDRYEYYFIPADAWDIKYTGMRHRDYGPFGNLGSQGWRYVNTLNDFHIFERKVRW